MNIDTRKRTSSNLIKDTIIDETNKLMSGKYYSFDSLNNMSVEDKVVALPKLSKEFNLDYDINTFEFSTEALKRLSKNRWNTAYPEAAGELKGDFVRMPIGPERINIPDKNISIHVDIQLDRVIFSTAREVRIVQTWNITKDEVVESVKGLDVIFPLFQELYGSYIQLDDRFESVHIWSKELAMKNKGRWEPILISKKFYNQEKQHSWNN